MQSCVIFIPEKHFNIAQKTVGHDIGPRLVEKHLLVITECEGVLYTGVIPELFGFFFTCAPMPVSFVIVFVICINSTGKWVQIRTDIS